MSQCASYKATNAIMGKGREGKGWELPPKGPACVYHQCELGDELWWGHIGNSCEFA
jgi:hypothetical protein